MKVPRDINGLELAKKVEMYGYKITRQTGSHIRLTTQQKWEHHITIPGPHTIKVGTLNSILKSISDHLEISKKEILKNLFG